MGIDIDLQNEVLDAEEAGRLYVSRRAISSKLLRKLVYRAWERSHINKANALALKAENLSYEELEKRLQQRADLLESAQPYMKALSKAAGMEHHATMLSDEQAVLLQVIGDPDTVQNPDFPRAGSLLSEATAGANGVGTTLAEASYIELVGHEHFIRGFHPFTCQGIPIHNPRGEIIGSISTSVQRPNASKRLRNIFLCAARGIEAELIHRQLDARVNELICTNKNDQVIEKLRQDLAQSLVSSKLKFQVASKFYSTKTEYALDLIRAAEESIKLFEAEAALWKQLAESDTGLASSFSLLELLQKMIYLLRTEFEVRHVRVVLKSEGEAEIFEFKKVLARKILNILLQELDKVKGGQIDIRVFSEQSWIKLHIGDHYQSFPGKTL